MKSLYSLALEDDVVRAIDRLAMARSMTRSALINAVLAEYASVLTPEEKINRIFRQLDQYMGSHRDIVPFLTENRPTMALKSSLAYKYRPTLRYEVELYREPEDCIGELRVIFRTQSEQLTRELTDFFRLWCTLENNTLGPLGRGEITYTLTPGRLTRPLKPREENRDFEALSKQLGDYISLLDRLLKAYLQASATPEQVEADYHKAIEAGIGLL